MAALPLCTIPFPLAFLSEGVGRETRSGFVGLVWIGQVHDVFSSSQINTLESE